ncbi:AAA family ATPase [Shinella zoogloeoides]|uniref:AAA family ATPase n=1 Tax=Shinella zoogloeoides TaxID=352475 RepID=UPI00273FF9C6|nr:MoxR family ATPase [Shinella zoogloeoides]WLR91038.1 MoxR family ATPase [Shinella zoogloeoides]
MADAADGKIICQIDGARTHSIQVHLRDNHPDWTIERYQKEYPDAPILSEKATQALAQSRAAKAQSAAGAGGIVTNAKKHYLHEVFGFGDARAARSSIGNPIEIQVILDADDEAQPYVQQVDPDYVFNIDLVKKVIIGFEINKPVYLWGFHGTGKTTVLEQVCARTGRPFSRVQHTINTEEAHILGQYVVRTKFVEEEVLNPTGEKVKIVKPQTVTEFQLGPLPMAMLHGWVYCADEYDFAMPSVTAVYQPVLEGKPLVIKDAPPEFRVIKPHPDFRFCATGNTNGVGDETGLYQGTLIQNAANYSRFPIVEEVEYMEAATEELILVSKTGIDKPTAGKIVKFAKSVRDAFKEGKISMTVSPRELINSADLGMYFGGDWKQGLKLSFANRLSRVDKKTVEEFAQRVFG